MGINSHSIDFYYTYAQADIPKVKDVYIEFLQSVFMCKQKHQSCGTKGSKSDSKQEASRRVRLIHDSLFPRKLSALYIWMTICYVPGHSQILSELLMNDINIIGGLLGEEMFLFLTKIGSDGEY